MDYLLWLNNNGFRPLGSSCGCQGVNQWHKFRKDNTEIKIYKKLNVYEIKRENIWSGKKPISELESEF
jgi:hypothetical protein